MNFLSCSYFKQIILKKRSEMKRLALFGGTGSMGRHFLKLALDEGYSVKALIRNPAKLELVHQNLTVIEGDVLNPTDVEKSIENTDIVVSLFGHSFGKKGGQKAPPDLQTRGTSTIVNAMKRFGQKRIISLSGGGVPFPEKDRPKFFPDKVISFVMKTFFSTLIEDGKNHVKVLKESGLEWMVVRGARFTDDFKHYNYRVGWVGVNSGASIGRKDLAHFILTQLEDQTYNYQMPLVSY
jgi:putative NADH-flavin reductase